MKILSSFQPNNTQKKVLAIVASCKEKPEKAISQLSSSENIISAKGLLLKLGLITVDNNGVQLTDSGKDVAIQQNILDDSEQLTPEGSQLISGDSNDRNMQNTQSSPSVEGDMQMPSPDYSNSTMEGFSMLFKELIQ